MEYLEDETLADRLKKGPVPLDQVLEYAIEIADALDKAHRQGITHRDLKPGNIILTKSATKPVDFGETAARCSTRPPSQLPAANEGIKASPRRARFWARCNTWHRSKWGQDSGQRDLRNHVVRSAADVVASAYDAAGVRPCGQEMLGQGSPRNDGKRPATFATT